MIITLSHLPAVPGRTIVSQMCHWPHVGGLARLPSARELAQKAWSAGIVMPARPTRQASAHRRPTSLLKQVGLARLLYGKSQQLIYELAKFGIVGGLAVLIADIGTNVLHFQAGVGPLISNVIATVVATAVSYVGNRYWTFRHRQRTDVSREGILFFVLNGIGLAIQLACLGFSTYVLGLHDRLSYNISLIIGIGLATLFRYGAYKKWVWRAQPPTLPATTQPRRERVLR
jgi:putative flippase GtrA